MTDVKVKIIQPKTETIDVNGLKLLIGEPPFELEADIDLLFGENAENRAWAAKQTPYLWVRQIDGEEVWPLAKYSEFRILRTRLGRDGYAAVIRAIEKLLKSDEDTVKNSPSTPNSEGAADS